jgi:phospholipid transport system substrate-binding protein
VLPAGGKIRETESPPDITDLLGKYIGGDLTKAAVKKMATKTPRRKARKNEPTACRPSLPPLWQRLSISQPSLRADAGLPTDQVRATVDNLTAILKNPALKSDAKKKDRRDLLRRAIYARFDFTEMAARSLGSYWRKLTPQQQDEFTRLFTDLLERAYIEQIESYSSEKFRLRQGIRRPGLRGSAEQDPNGKGRGVSNQLSAPPRGRDCEGLRRRRRKHRLVNNYRSQFNRVIANQSYDELVRRMKDKQIQTAIEKRKRMEAHAGSATPWPPSD